MKNQQRGGTILGLIFGMIIGLAAALAVAIYVTKVPVPFITKGGKTGTQQDASESERNKNWNPNGPLESKAPLPAQQPSVPVDSGPAAQPPAVSGAATPGVVTPGVATPGVAPSPGEGTTTAGARNDGKSGKGSDDPLGDLVKSRSAAADKAERVAQASAPAQIEPGFNYFIQAGAFRGQREADAQRAKLAMLGWEARISEREQNGITVFRVRVGPFGKREDAEQLKQKLDGAGVDSALVRVAK